jgi:hypothetical protein
MVAITDNNPKSPVIQNLPPALFTLMKSTEPWTDEYYVFDIGKVTPEIYYQPNRTIYLFTYTSVCSPEQALVDAGFVDVRTEATDPRHRTILARKK